MHSRIEHRTTRDTKGTYVSREVWMLERFLNCQSLFRIEGLTRGVSVKGKEAMAIVRVAYQSLVEEIDRFYRGLRKQRGEWTPLADWQ